STHSARATTAPRLSLALMFLFSHSHRAPCDLHSFPTRRSSDLADINLTAHQQRRRQKKGARRLECMDVCWLSKQVIYRRHKSAEDRKSTRLNSSHVSISYAVFCLKKKKKNQRNHVSNTVCGRTN